MTPTGGVGSVGANLAGPYDNVYRASAAECPSLVGPDDEWCELGVRAGWVEDDVVGRPDLEGLGDAPSDVVIGSLDRDVA